MGESTLSVVSVPSPVRENPYQGLLYEALRDHGVHLLPVPPSRFASVARTTWGPRVLHVHWLFLKSGAVRRRLRALRFRRMLRAARRSGWRIVWTAHNLMPHEASPLDEDLTGHLAAHADGIICHGDWARDELGRRLAPRGPIRVIPHGHYRTYYGPSLPRADARAGLGLGSSRPLIVCIGKVRPYKGVEVLVERIRGSDLDVDLIVAGRPMDSATEDALRVIAGDDDRIHLDLRYVPDDAVPALMSAADWVVLPFRRITTSGSLLLALGFGVPVIAPAHPAIMEVAAPNALETFADDDDLVPAIGRAIRRDRSVAASAAIASTATLDWSDIGAATARFFRQVTAAPAVGGRRHSP